MFKWRSRRTNQEDKLHSSSHEFRLLVFLSFFSLLHTHLHLLIRFCIYLSTKNSPIQAPKPYSYLLHLFFKSHQHGDHKPFVSHSFLCFVLDYFMYYLLLPSFLLFFDLCCYSNLLRFFFSLPFEHSSSL